MMGPQRSFAKRVAYAALGNSAANWLRLKSIERHGVATVLSLHRVAPYDDSTYPPLDPMLFRRLLAFCKKHFSVVTLAELGEGGFDRPPLVLSFDDGYRDFYEYAAPIMADAAIRCNHNLIPRALETGRPPLNVILADYCGRAPEEHLAALDIANFPKFQPGQSRGAFGDALSAFTKNRPFAQQLEIEAQALPQLERTEEFSPTPVMTLAQACEVASVHEIGAHSYEHANLGEEQDGYVSGDAARCKAWFRDRMSVDTAIYAVPNGSYRPHQLALLEKAGFETILLVGQRFTRPDSTHHHRFNFDAVGHAEMRFKALGGLCSLQ